MDLRIISCDIPGQRRVHLAQIDHPDDWPEDVDLGSPHFISLVAVDARELTDEAIITMAEKLLDRGLANVHTFGPSAERTHMLFDRAVIGRSLRSVDHPDAMTSNAGANESIDAALWYATFVLWPPDPYDDGANPLLVLVIGNPGWAEHLETRLLDFDRFACDMEPSWFVRRLDPLIRFRTRRRIRRLAQQISRRN